MRAAFLEDADPAAVAHAIRGELDRRGALVSEHVSTRVRFQSRPADRWSWTRAGYVGLYQAYGEKDVEVRLLLRARWPHRIFWGTAVAVLVLCLLTILIDPPGTTWFLVAFAGGFALLVSTLLYMNTWRGVREEERAIMEGFEAAIRAAAAAGELRRPEDRELEALEADIEGELERRRVKRDDQAARAAAPPKAPRFKLRR